MRGQRSMVFGLASMLALGGCMTSGTNLHGDFACKAPEGTCAPMSMIDASAVAAIGGAQGISGIADSPAPGRARVVASGYDASAVPARTADRVLKVVFPAHIDADGVFREEATAHAVIETGAWVEALRGGSRSKGENPQVPHSMTGQVESPAAGSALATLDEILAAKAATTPSAAERQAHAVPTTMAVPSHSPVPQSLREAAAGLSAPSMAMLDPRKAEPGFDAPDTVAAVLPGPDDLAGATPGHETGAARVADPATPAVTRFAATQNAPSSTASRTVRWHGRWYRLPGTHPTTIEGAGAKPETWPPAPSATAVLNRDVLRKLGEAPAVATTATAPDSSPMRAAATNAGSSVPAFAANPGATK